MSIKPANADDLLIKIIAAILLLCLVLWIRHELQPAMGAPPAVVPSHPVARYPAPQAAPPEEYVQPAKEAPRLYKCVSRSGSVSFTSEPCLEEARTAWAKQANTAEDSNARAADSSQEKLARAQADLDQAIQHSTPQQAYFAAPATGAVSLECQSAKQDRESFLAIVGNRRNFDLLRVLNDRVWEACKGA